MAGGLFMRAAGKTLMGGTRLAGRGAESVLSGVGGAYTKMWDIPFQGAFWAGRKAIGPLKSGVKAAFGAGVAAVPPAAKVGMLTGKTAGRLGFAAGKRGASNLINVAKFVQRRPRTALAAAGGLYMMGAATSGVKQLHDDYSMQQQEMQLATQQSINAAMAPTAFKFQGRRAMNDMNAGNHTLASHYARI